MPNKVVTPQPKSEPRRCTKGDIVITPSGDTWLVISGGYVNLATGYTDTAMDPFGNFLQPSSEDRILRGATITITGGEEI